MSNDQTPEKAHLSSWTPDYVNEKGEEFYDKRKVEIILFEYRQKIAKSNSENVEDLIDH